MKIFKALAREAEEIAIPEEGNLKSATDTPVIESTEDTNTAPTEDVDPQDSKPEEKVEEDTVIEDNTQAADELAKVTITLEAFAQQIAEGDMDSQSRAVVDCSIGSIQKDLGIDDEPVAATENFTDWVAGTMQSIERIRVDAKRGFNSAQEGIWDKIKALIGGVEIYLKQQLNTLTVAIHEHQPKSDFKITITSKEYPHLFLRDRSPSDKALDEGVTRASFAALMFSNFINEVVNQKVKDPLADLDKMFQQSTNGKATIIDLSMGVGTQGLFGIIEKTTTPDGKFAVQSFCLTSKDDQFTPTDVSVATIDNVKMLYLLKNAREGCAELQRTITWLKETQKIFEEKANTGKLETNQAEQYKAISDMCTTTISVMIPLAFGVWFTLVKLSK